MLNILPLLLLATQSPTITVTMAPTPLPKALETLSKLSGRRLVTVPALAEEVVFARLKDAPLNVALSHLAESLLAKWETGRDGSARMVPDRAAMQKLDQQESEAKDRVLDEGLAYLRKRLGQEPKELDQAAIEATRKKREEEDRRHNAALAANDNDRAWVFPSANEEEPAWRAAARIVLLIDSDQLRAMPEGAKEVWAENPTPMQHAMPTGADEVLAAYRRELALAKPDALISRVRVTVTREGEHYVRLVGCDGHGVPVDFAQVRVEDVTLRKLPVSQRPGFIADSGHPPIDLPAEVCEARVALSNPLLYHGAERPGVIAKWRPKLLDPVHFEPTQWFVGEDLILAADALGKNLIGTVNDILDVRFRPTVRKVSTSEILNRRRQDLLPSTDGWMIVRSRQRIARLPRWTAAAFIADAVGKGGVTVDAGASWTTFSPDYSLFTGWLSDYLETLFPEPGAVPSILDLHNLEFWDSLGSGVRDSLRRGAKVRLSALPPQAQSRLAQGVYWYNWLDDEHAVPTEALPNGISDGTINMSVPEVPLFRGWSSKSDPPRVIQTFSAEQMGRALAAKQGSYEQMDRFRLGVHRTYTLHMLIEPGKQPITMALDEHLFDPNGEVLSDLPASFKADMERYRLDALAHPRPPGEYPPSPPPVKNRHPAAVSVDSIRASP